MVYKGKRITACSAHCLTGHAHQCALGKVHTNHQMLVALVLIRSLETSTCGLLVTRCMEIQLQDHLENPVKWSRYLLGFCTIITFNYAEVEGMDLAEAGGLNRAKVSEGKDLESTLSNEGDR